MNRYLVSVTVILLLSACSSSRNWQGTSTLDGTQADFEELNGKQAFTIVVPHNDTYLKYHFRIKRGKLETIIKSPDEMILSKEIGGMEADSIHLLNQKGTRYKVYLKGKQASGDFDISFNTNSD